MVEEKAGHKWNRLQSKQDVSQGRPSPRDLGDSLKAVMESWTKENEFFLLSQLRIFILFLESSSFKIWPFLSITKTRYMVNVEEYASQNR